MKETLFQAFEWYLESEPSLYSKLKQEASHLSNLGITRIWMPPAYKGQAGLNDVGYGVYDLYDLGEFDQKGTVRTKYGTKEEYLQVIDTFHTYHIEVIADIVLNHRMGADAKETILAKPMNWQDRNQEVGPEQTVEVWTKYTFPGRQGKYSDFTWNWTHFDGTDYDDLSKRTELLEFQGKSWDEHVSKEEGNFDFIMGDDLDFNNPEVVQELKRWGAWYKEMTGVDGYRLDAVKSIDSHFFKGWLEAIQNTGYVVGEYWSGNVEELISYLQQSSYCMKLFDVPFHFNLYNASSSYDRYDMRTLFDRTLVTYDNLHACAFVDNHDTQPGQALQSWIQPWFKLHAYSLILLRNFESPCVFYGDLYGIARDQYPGVEHLDELIWLRSHLLEDEIEDHFDDYHCVGWRVGANHVIIVVMTNGNDSSKEFYIDGFKGRSFIDITSQTIVQINENNCGIFPCKAGSCSIFIEVEKYQMMKEDLKNENRNGM